MIIDFSRYPVGTKVTLKNRIGDGTTADVMQFHVTRKENDESAIHEQLSDMAEFDKLDASGTRLTREFNFTRAGHEGKVVWGINGEVFDPGRMDARPRLGSTEIWEFTTDVNHPVHLHSFHFKVLSRQALSRGGKPLLTDAGWKDTIYLRPREVARVLARFDG